MTATFTADFAVATDRPDAGIAAQEILQRAFADTAAELNSRGVKIQHSRLVPTMWTGMGEKPPVRAAATITALGGRTFDAAMAAITVTLQAHQVTFLGAQPSNA